MRVTPEAIVRAMNVSSSVVSDPSQAGRLVPKTRGAMGMGWAAASTVMMAAESVEGVATAVIISVSTSTSGSTAKKEAVVGTASVTIVSVEF